MFINEARGIVDLIVNDHVDIFLRVVLGDLSICQFFRHSDDWKIFIASQVAIKTEDAVVVKVADLQVKEKERVEGLRPCQ